MTKKIKKSVSILLALVMLCGVLAVAPVTVNAAVTEYTVGTAKYSFNSDNGNLHLISGEFNSNSWGSNIIPRTDVLTITATENVTFKGYCSQMFSSFSNCTSIDLAGVNVYDGWVNMSNMFANLNNLISLDLSGFLRKAIDNSFIANMFKDSQNIQKITLSDSINATSPSGGIVNVMKLNDGNTHDPGWVKIDNTTGKAVSGYVYSGSSIPSPTYGTTSTYVWLSSTQNYELIEDEDEPGMYTLHLISGVFTGSSWWRNDFDRTKIKHITATDDVIFTSVCNNMFSGFSACESINLSKVNTTYATNMINMFSGCTALTSIDVSGFNTSNVNYMTEMFANCTNLTSIDISNFRRKAVDNSYVRYMFKNTSNLKEITVSFAINTAMTLINGEYNGNPLRKYNGWRIKGDPTFERVSGGDDYANTPDPSTKTTYIWIGYYCVDWLNEDGTKLSVEQYKVDADTHPTYKGATPTNPDPDDTTSTFVGWIDDLGNTYDKNAELPAVTRDTTYTARFEEPKTEYILNYIYQGRKGGNNGGYVGDDEATDEKTYTVTIVLGDSEVEESGMPKDKVLVDNAPVVNDPYKNCRWTIDDEHVIFDPETKIVTITAEQPERKYSVVFKNSNNETTDVFRVKLNDFVKKNDSFITAEETDGSGTKFAYWSVVQNNKEVARCFERKFNLRVTGDSVVTANYGEAENLISLSDAEITRQPIYQNGIPKDCLYADFITAYMDKQGMELSKKSSSEYKTGLILQYNKEILVKENEPGATLNANDKITFGSDYELTAADAKTIADGETVSGKYSYKSISIDNSKYNDKNRLNKALPIENTELNRRMVYCAYYYVYNVKAGKIEMTAPVYFYLYDKGNEINTEN